MPRYPKAEWVARWEVETLVNNLAAGLFHLTTASSPPWVDLPGMLALGPREAVTVHVSETVRCRGCQGAEGYFFHTGERIVLREGLCQKCDAPKPWR